MINYLSPPRFPFGAALRFGTVVAPGGTREPCSGGG